MHIPKHFKIEDREEIESFIQSNSFGTIVSTEAGKPIATHLPFQLQKQGEDYYVTSHFAYANSQWKTLENNPDPVLVMLQGPHAYVSSSWYDHENVPTWNYQSVHIYGKAEIMTSEELEQDLITLLEKYEQHRADPVLWDKLTDQTKQQIKGIVGFKIKVEEIQAAYKMSQNRSEEDYQNVIYKLSRELNPSAQQVSEAMREISRKK
ncbi:FMN-binding negative transcriptional regulator [Oceanobacillus sp. CAU 1775]